MKILFTTQALSIGGIEVVALRFSEAFSAAGHEVSLYDFNPDRRNAGLVAQFDTTRFQLVGMQPPAWKNRLIWKCNAALFKTGLNKEFRQQLIERHFARFIRDNDFDIVCSFSFHQDYLACKYCRSKGTPVVVSMHGTYEYAAPEWTGRARAIYDYISAIIYAADKNMSWYQKQPYFRHEMPVFKIYTGADLATPVPQTTTRADLGILPEAFVYILVARGIAEKGWEEAIQALLALLPQHPHAVLLLVGDSDYVQQLKQRYAAESSIIFYGFHPNSVELTQLADVGLLPTYFPIETLPNVIIDYLRCGLPVISTDIGEIKEMLGLPNGQSAGTVLPLLPNGSGVEVETLREAMASYMTNPTRYQETASLARQAVLKFDMQDSVRNYTQVFTQVLGK